MREKYYIKCKGTIKIGILYDIEKGSLVVGGNQKIRKELELVVTDVFGINEDSLDCPTVRQGNKVRYVCGISPKSFRKGIKNIEDSTLYMLHVVPCLDVPKLHDIM